MEAALRFDGISDGNFRLLHRQAGQAGRIFKINALPVITGDVIEAARSTRVAGNECQRAPEKQRRLILKVTFLCSVIFCKAEKLGYNNGMLETSAHPRRYHFLSGLPRSGSTLLAAILRQNPRFSAGMSSPVAGLVQALLHEMSGQNEFSVFINNAQRQRILRGVAEHYYAGTSAAVAFDTNRSWCGKLPVLAALFPDSKVIACVRDLPWIFDSIERLVRRNAFEPSSLFHYQSGGTVYTRVNGLAGPEGLVGYAYDALKEAYYGELAAGRLMLVQYESLVSHPERTLQALYAFLEEPPYTHDLGHVVFEAEAYDRKAGTPGLHEIRPRVEAVERTTILPPELFQKFRGDAFWKDPSRIRKDIPVL